MSLTLIYQKCVAIEIAPVNMYSHCSRVSTRLSPHYSDQTSNTEPERVLDIRFLYVYL